MQYNIERTGSYTPLRKHLREIRLLQLFPGEPRDDISCELEVVSLDSKPDFEAVSYVWGNRPAVRHIKLNCKKLLVTPNIEALLRRLRNRKQKRSLWLDSICIDQKNVEERNLQVALMRDIFMGSRRVLVMLGESQGTQLNSEAVWHNNSTDSSEIEKALHGYERHGQVPFALAHTVQPDYLYGAFWFIRLLAKGVHLSDIPFLHSQSYRENVFKALQHIMDSPWWNRIWVIQELVLAPRATIFIGHLQAPWEMLARAAKNCELHQMDCCRSIIGFLPRKEVDILGQFSRTVLDFDEVRHRWDRGSQTNLLQLLWQFRSRESMNHADKVYALLGLANTWGRRQPMLPDYKLTVHQVYREVVREVIGSTNSLAILMGNLDKHDDLPTWVPDWRIPVDPLELQRLQRVDLYDACRGSSPSYRLLGDDVLELAGWRIDTISAVSDLMMRPGEIQSISIFQKWYHLAELDAHPQRTYVNGGTWADAYWRTLCGDTVFNGEIGGLVQLVKTAILGPHSATASYMGSGQGVQKQNIQRSNRIIGLLWKMLQHGLIMR